MGRRVLVLIAFALASLVACDANKSITFRTDNTTATSSPSAMDIPSGAPTTTAIGGSSAPPNFSATDAPTPGPAVVVPLPTSRATTPIASAPPAPSARAVPTVTPAVLPVQTITPGGDRVPPVATTLSTTPKVVTPGGTVTLLVTATDDGGSAISSVLVCFTSSAGGTQFGTLCPHLELVSGDTFSGTWQLAFAIVNSSPSSRWTINDLVLVDAAGNRRDYHDPGDSLAAGGSFAVAAPPPSRTIAPGGDNFKPIVTAISTSTLTAAPGSSVTVTMAAHDDGGSGIEHLLMNYVFPDGTLVFGSALEFQVVRGDKWDGTWAETFVVSPFAANGTWKLHDIVVIDAAGNRTVHFPTESLFANVQLTIVVPTPRPSATP